MNYKYLLIDHDDTCVDSTPKIHYPSHIIQMKRLGREDEILSLEEWLKVNYSPGITEYLDSTLKLNSSEKDMCYRIWREHSTGKIPRFFPGILQLMDKFKRLGGTVVVVSHSEEEMIRDHYSRQKESPGFFPDLIIGWNGDGSKNKPDPWPVFNVMEKYGAEKREIIVVDDLKPGIIMAAKAGVDSAGVGWSHRIPEIMEDMKENCTFYVSTVDELGELLFGKGADH